VEESCKFALHGSNIKSEFHQTSKPWTVDVDEGQISQVISNIVINAKQAMPEGGIIAIQFENTVIGPGNESRLRPGRYVKISIKDQGSGIPKEHLPRIFDPYFTTKEAGNGLGLATSYSIVTKHDGCITATSELGEGTTLHVFLPACDIGGVESYDRPVEPVYGKGRILVIDDEMMILDVTSELLRSLGYEVETAQEGNTALRLYREAMGSNAPYDAVIIDLTIPGGMGGKKIVKRLLEVDPSVKAIASSGYSNDPVMSKYREHGFCDVIPKPYRIQNLGEILRRVLRETA
jgi:CheY-like chemotaxis protein/anti-sigma regulatory factor (Ser/Thr protein kinase)